MKTGTGQKTPFWSRTCLKWGDTALFQLQQPYRRSWVISNASMWLSSNKLTHHELKSSLLHEAETLKLRKLARNYRLGKQRRHRQSCIWCKTSLRVEWFQWKVASYPVKVKCWCTLNFTPHWVGQTAGQLACSRQLPYELNTMLQCWESADYSQSAPYIVLEFGISLVGQRPSYSTYRCWQSSGQGWAQPCSSACWFIPSVKQTLTGLWLAFSILFWYSL